MRTYRTGTTTSFYSGGDDAGPAPGKRTLTMGYRQAPANDAVEQEADATAARVVSGLGGGGIGAAPIEVRFKATGPVDAAAAAQVEGARGGGAALPEPVRAQMERAFGADFADVRVHVGSGLAADLGARAMTRGTDLHFAPGQYDPASRGGQELIAHELTHVVQQRGGAPGLDFKLTEATVGKKGAGFHAEKGSDAVGKKLFELPAGRTLMVDPDAMIGEYAYAEYKEQAGYVKLRKVDVAAAAAVDDAFAATGAAHADGRLDAEDEHDAGRQDARDAVSRGRGALAESKGEASKTTKALEAAGKVTSLGMAPAIDAALEDKSRLKASLPLSTGNKVKLKLGQVLNVLGALPGAVIPVVGDVIGAPLTAAGTTMTAHAQGASLGRSAAKGAATAAAGMATGAIPVAGQIDGAVGLASAADALLSKVPGPTKSKAIELLSAFQAELDAEIDAATARGSKSPMSDAEFADTYKQVVHYLAKYQAAVEAKEDAGTRGLLKA